MTIQSYEIRALDDFGGRIHWIPSDLGAWCPADSVRRLEADMEALKAELAALKSQSNLYPPCKGANCGCTDGVSHSSECFAEHEAAITGGKGFEGEA